LDTPNKRQFRGKKSKASVKSPIYFFGFFAFLLLGFGCFGAGSLTQMQFLRNGSVTTLSAAGGEFYSESTFFKQANQFAKEAPDLKIIQDSFVYGISTPRILTTQTLGSLFGESAQVRREVENYLVQPGDTIQSIAVEFEISVDTLLWANNLSKNSTLKVNQQLVVLPVSGVVHIVKSGDIVSQIGKTYKANIEEIIVFNGLANEGDIFIGDILVIPGGTMPAKPVAPVSQSALADSFFIYPIEGKISQGLHWYNAVDIANKCGTPVYAAASGQIQRVRYGWNSGGGNLITILHSGGISTYYGHLMTIFVKSGDKVAVGEKIGLVGNTGLSTGCHLHFGVTGARNPLNNHAVGATLKYK
jgi:murein DD-endopeptidase MepM/ murein hydrolase activator NlpD